MNMKMVGLSSTCRASVWDKYGISTRLLEQCLVYGMCSVSESQCCCYHPQHFAMPQNLFLYLQRPLEPAWNLAFDTHMLGQGRVFLEDQPSTIELPKEFWGLCVIED